jgi:hypothetical protein
VVLLRVHRNTPTAATATMMTMPTVSMSAPPPGWFVHANAPGWRDARVPRLA